MYKLVALDLRYKQNVEELQRSAEVEVLIRSPDGKLIARKSSGQFGPEKTIVAAINDAMAIDVGQKPPYLITDCDYGNGKYFLITVAVGNPDLHCPEGQGEGNDFYVAFAYAYTRALSAWKRQGK